MGVFSKVAKQHREQRHVGPKRAFNKMLAAVRASNRKKRIGSARPLRALRTNYRAINTYRFMRETIPSTASFTMIAAGPGFPQMGYMSFENLQFNQLPGNTDFSNLFARYKVDLIVTTLVPLYQVATQVNHQSQLEITKVNTKYLNGDFPIAANADLQLSELAQLQCKTKTLYAQDKPIKLITKHPGVLARSVIDSVGNEVDARGTCPWLALNTTSMAIPFKHNAIIFGARVDGQGLTTDWKYRVTHKVYFRCSQVG